MSCCPCRLHGSSDDRKSRFWSWLLNRRILQNFHNQVRQPQILNFGVTQSTSVICYFEQQIEGLENSQVHKSVPSTAWQAKREHKSGVLRTGNHLNITFFKVLDLKPRSMRVFWLSNGENLAEVSPERDTRVKCSCCSFFIHFGFYPRTIELFQAFYKQPSTILMTDARFFVSLVNVFCMRNIDFLRKLEIRSRLLMSSDFFLVHKLIRSTTNLFWIRLRSTFPSIFTELCSL